MRANLLPVLGAAAALLAGSPALALDPLGEVTLVVGGSGTSAGFDDEHVVGPLVNMTRTQDGDWAGDLVGQNLDLSFEGGRTQAPNFTIAYGKTGDRLEVEGLVEGMRVRVTLDPKRATGRFGDCSFDLKRTATGVFRGTFGCLPSHAPPTTGIGELTLRGKAADADAPEPQLALALLSVLPR
jgi:hypothetical protein